jgi:hypothetical protein
MDKRMLAALAPSLLVCGLAAPAQAGPAFEAGTYDETFSFTSTGCARIGVATRHQWGRYALRETEPGAPEVIVHDVGQFELHIVTSDGSWWIRGRTNFKVRSVTRVEGDVWRLELTSAGRTWVLSSESGVEVWADRGIVHETIVLDTRGDDDPENDVLVSDDIDWNGPHFFSDTQPGSQYCQYVDEALALG